MKACDKDNFREIKNSLPRFISILIIVFLGVFVLIGLLSTGQVMRNTLDNKITQLNQEDLKISVLLVWKIKTRLLSRTKRTSLSLNTAMTRMSSYWEILLS